MKTCAACKAKTELQPLLSILDFKVREVCVDCFDHQAEPETVVREMTEHLNLLPGEILEAARVFQGGSYLPLTNWQATSETPSHDPDEDEALPILERIKEVTPYLDSPDFLVSHRPRYGTVRSLALKVHARLEALRLRGSIPLRPAVGADG